MSHQNVATFDLGPVVYEAQAFQSKRVGEPLILNGYDGTGLSIKGAATFPSTTHEEVAPTSKCSRRMVAVNNGNTVQISGGIALGAETFAQTANTWETLMTLTFDNSTASYNQGFNMLRPHPAVIGYCGINGAGNAGDTLGTDDDPGVAAAESFICGTCVMGEGAGAYVGAGTAALCGIVRLLCTAANTYDVQCLFPTVITAEPTSTVYPGIALWLSYPAAPTSMLMSHN